MIDPSNNKIIGNFKVQKLIQLVLKEGKDIAMKADLYRFIDKNFILFDMENDVHEKILAAASCNFPIYTINAQGMVNLINPFSLLLLQ